MRITAVLISYPPDRWIGSDIATHRTLRMLSGRGHDVLVLSGSCKTPYKYEGVRVQRLAGAAGVLRRRGGIVWTHPYRSEELSVPVECSKLPVVLMMHSDRGEVRQQLGKRRGDVRVANSMATARGLGLWPVVGKVLVARPLAADQGPPIGPRPRAGPLPLAGFVNGTAMKGGWFIEQLLARGLDRGDYGFLGVPGAYGEDTLEHTPNVQAALLQEQLEPGRMVGEYFRRIAVHLQPSMSESWGMAALEALAEGVPVVSSDLPGTREALAGFGPRWVRWINPRSESPDREIDRGIRDVLSAGPASASDDAARRESVARSRRTAELDHEALAASLEAWYG